MLTNIHLRMNPAACVSQPVTRPGKELARQISVVTFLNSLHYIGFFPPCLNSNWLLREKVAGLARITSSYERLSYHGFTHQAALPPRLCWYQDVCSAAILRGDLSDVATAVRGRPQAGNVFVSLIYCSCSCVFSLRVKGISDVFAGRCAIWQICTNPSILHFCEAPKSQD